MFATIIAFAALYASTAIAGVVAGRLVGEAFIAADGDFDARRPLRWLARQEEALRDWLAGPALYSRK